MRRKKEDVLGRYVEMEKEAQWGMLSRENDIRKGEKYVCDTPNRLGEKGRKLFNSSSSASGAEDQGYGGER